MGCCKEEDLETDEFNEYKENCLASGWKYVCAFENIIVFYSEEERRPQELQRESEVKRDILKRITLRTELKQMGLRLATAFFIIALYASSFYIQWSKNSMADKRWWDLPLCFMWILIIIIIAWEAVAAKVRVKNHE